MSRPVSLTMIRIDGGTQTRVEINQAVLEDYATAMAEGSEFPPVVVFFDGAAYWLADGFHRYWAAQKNGAENIAADVREGTQWDAVLFSVGANDKHGLQRTSDDIRKAVHVLLDSGKCLTWSDNQIAKQCKIACHTAGKYRSEWSALHDAKVPTARVGADGKTYDTANIGKRKKSEPREPEQSTGGPWMRPDPPPEQPPTERRPDPPSNGMQFARIAVMKLEQITRDDLEREQALRFVIDWAKGQLNG